ncbi:MAG: hypothetical protein KBS46_04915, partial [Clostridiales bacterium]|nr:hypothetical protein [Candidatus Apopatocola equi]
LEEKQAEIREIADTAECSCAIRDGLIPVMSELRALCDQPRPELRRSSGPTPATPICSSA